METLKEEKDLLRKQNPLLYFIVFKSLNKKYRANLIILYNFIKTANGYLDKNPIDQDSYFDFKDRYYKAKEGIYQKDGFVAELYPFICQTSFKKKAETFPWNKWIEDFLVIKDLELSSFSFDKQEDLYDYLRYYNGLVYSFAFLSDWTEVLHPYLIQFFRISKYQELILRAERDASLSRRYLPLLDSSLLSFSHIEFVRKKDSYNRLIQEHLSLGGEEIQKLEKEISFLPKKQRALFYLILRSLKKRQSKMYKNPEKVFLKPPSFNFSLKKLEILFFYYRVKVFFQKDYPLKKGEN